MVKASLTFALLLCGALAGCASTQQAADRAAFTPSSCADFEAVTSPAAGIDAICTRQPDGVFAIAGKPSGYLASRASYGDYRLHMEWRWSGKPGNGGLLLHIAFGPKDGVWPLSVQVQTKHGFVGDILPMAGARFTEPLTTAPGAYPAIKARTGADSERPAGEWNTLDVVSRGGTVEVTVNGVVQNRVSGLDPRRGPVGLQLEGVPYELRNLKLTPLD